MTPRAPLPGRRAALPHARGRPPAARRRRDVRRGAAHALETRVAPDERHRIPLAMRCLLVEHPDGLVLIDTGAGQQGGRASSSTSTASRTRGSRARRSWRTRWRRPASCRPTCAGSSTPTCTSIMPAATPRIDPELESDPRRHVGPTFPNATYVVQRGELEFARHTNERTRASYLPPNFEPMAAAGRWQAARGRRRGAAGHLGPAHARARALPPGRAGAERRRDRGLHRRPDPDDARTCRCPGSWATTWSRSARSRASGRFSATRWPAGGGWCSSTIRGGVGVRWRREGGRWQERVEQVRRSPPERRRP